MRDPEGRVRFLPLQIERELYEPIAKDHFIFSKTAQSFVEKGWLIPFSVERKLIRSPRVPFVSYPFEWCDAQFADAASLTLSISEEAFASGYELKDASAWNVVFKSCAPCFCDHLSFQKITKPQWWALTLWKCRKPLAPSGAFCPSSSAWWAAIALACPCSGMSCNLQRDKQV